MATAIRKIYQNVQLTRTVIRDSNRFRQIVTVLVRHGLGAVIQGLRLQESWVPGLLRKGAAADVEGISLARRFKHALQELGPTFVKLGQILSTRPDLIPPEFTAELAGLQDRVPPFPSEEVRGQVQSALGKPAAEIFESFEEKPLASASIAQVHRARLRSGEEVAVKVQRPAIRPQIECDVEILTFLARQMEANFPETRLFSPVGIVKEFEKAILKEIDFRIELEHIERFRRGFKEKEGIVFPKPYEELTSEQVLVMEFLDGVKITEIVGKPEYDRERVVKLGIRAIFQMVFEDGFIHADLHPGNLLVLPGSNLGFIDCGLVGVLTGTQRDHLCGLLIGIVRQDYRGLSRTLWEMAIHNRPQSYFETFEGDVTQIFQKWFGGKSIQDLEFGGFFKDLIDGAMRHQMIMPPDYTMTFKAMVTMEGIAKQLCPEINVIEEARPYVTRMLAERYSPTRILSDLLDNARSFGKALRYLPERINETLEEVREGRTRLNVEVAETRRLLDAYRRAQNRTQLAVLEAALVLAGTFALDHPGPEFFGLPGLSVVFYGLAGFLALGHFLGILRSGGL